MTARRRHPLFWAATVIAPLAVTAVALPEFRSYWPTVAAHAARIVTLRPARFPWEDRIQRTIDRWQRDLFPSARNPQGRAELLQAAAWLLRNAPRALAEDPDPMLVQADALDLNPFRGRFGQALHHQAEQWLEEAQRLAPNDPAILWQRWRQIWDEPDARSTGTQFRLIETAKTVDPDNAFWHYLSVRAPLHGLPAVEDVVVGAQCPFYRDPAVDVRHRIDTFLQRTPMPRAVQRPLARLLDRRLDRMAPLRPADRLGDGLIAAYWSTAAGVFVNRAVFARDEASVLPLIRFFDQLWQAHAARPTRGWIVEGMMDSTLLLLDDRFARDSDGFRALQQQREQFAQQLGVPALRLPPPPTTNAMRGFTEMDGARSADSYLRAYLARKMPRAPAAPVATGRPALRAVDDLARISLAVALLSLLFAAVLRRPAKESVNQPLVPSNRVLRVWFWLLAAAVPLGFQAVVAARDPSGPQLLEGIEGLLFVGWSTIWGAVAALLATAGPGRPRQNVAVIMLALTLLGVHTFLRVTDNIEGISLWPTLAQFVLVPMGFHTRVSIPGRELAHALVPPAVAAAILAGYGVVRRLHNRRSADLASAQLVSAWFLRLPAIATTLTVCLVFGTAALYLLTSQPRLVLPLPPPDYDLAPEPLEIVSPSDRALHLPVRALAFNTLAHLCTTTGLWQWFTCSLLFAAAFLANSHRANPDGPPLTLTQRFNHWPAPRRAALAHNLAHFCGWLALLATIVHLLAALAAGIALRTESLAGSV